MGVEDELVFVGEQLGAKPLTPFMTSGHSADAGVPQQPLQTLFLFFPAAT